MAKKENKQTGMMIHYNSVKEKYKDCIIFYRLGDFYELFYEDAILVSDLLDLVLTGKNCGLEERAPMCGFPHDAADVYAAKLIDLGYKVAICEQITAAKKGVPVEREVVKVITPGTITEGSLLDDKKNNFIANVFIENDNEIALVWSDITTGEFFANNISEDNAINTLNDILIRIHPAELICRECDIAKLNSISAIKYNYVSNVFKYNDWAYNLESCTELIKKQFGESGYLEINNAPYLVRCAGALIAYLIETQKRFLQNINKITIQNPSKYLYMDINTRRNLELLETVRDKKRKGSLLWLLDETKTSMGARMLRNFIESPLTNEKEINYRLDATEELFKNLVMRDELADVLSNISDIERLCCKISYGSINPKEVVKLKQSLQYFPKVKEVLSKFKSKLLCDANENISDFKEITEYLNNAINDDAPVTIKDGKVIKDGFNAELDKYRSMSLDRKEWLNKIEKQEKDETGIKNLRIKFNSVFGYYIEVTNSQLDLVPYRYERKQTLTGAERFITPELKKLEQEILHADEEINSLQVTLFQEVKDKLISILLSIQQAAKNIAIIDTMLSLSIVATKNNYCRPKILKSSKQIEIIDGRHPIVEKINKELFIANDTFLDDNENRTMIITGPNMAGKSTYMRQVALITLMAHMGSFVPASKANICLTDKIFTRIGASDDLTFGQSTFMVEMIEVSNILKHATSNSLILLDEVGRGTATFDGLSIAWAVMDYIANNLKCKTLFSTHYHELSELEGILSGVKNFRVTVKEFNNNIIFLRKIVRGSANKSFGIAVAKLAGLPVEVLMKAEKILKSLETTDLNKNIKQEEIENSKEFEIKTTKAIEVCNIIKDIDLNKLTPIEAMQILYELSLKVK